MAVIFALTCVTLCSAYVQLTGTNISDGFATSGAAIAVATGLLENYWGTTSSIVVRGASGCGCKLASIFGLVKGLGLARPLV